MAEAFCLVHLDELRMEVGGHAVAQLLDGVDAGGLEQFGKLSGHTLDAEEVGVVGFCCSVVSP